MAKKKSKYGLRVAIGALSLAGALWFYNDYRVNTPSYIVNHALSIRNPTEKKKIILKNTKIERHINSEEGQRDLETVLSSSPFKRKDILKMTLSNSYNFNFVDFEKNTKLAKKLARLGEDSINHMFNYVQSPYIKKENFRFIVPKREEEIEAVSKDGADIYIVSSIGNRIETKYQILLINGSKLYPMVYKNESGAAGDADIKVRVVAKERGFNVESEENTPIFYNVSSEKVRVVETPVIEMLHRALRAYTLKYFKSDISDIPLEWDLFYKSLNKWKDREETIVHAISTLWLKQYNIDRNLELSDLELNKRFSSYNGDEVYGQVNKFAEYIGKIGIKVSIEQYAENPDKLFEDSEKR